MQILKREEEVLKNNIPFIETTYYKIVDNEEIILGTETTAKRETTEAPKETSQFDRIEANTDYLVMLAEV